MGVKISALSTAVLTDVSFDDVLPIVDLIGPTTLRVTLDIVRQSMFDATGYTAVALTGVTSVTFSTKVISTTALATPLALVATTGQFFASTVSGATFMGFGTTGDVTLKNRAGTDVLVVTANTLNVTMAGALAIVGALSGVTTLAASGSIAANGGIVIAASQALTGTVANSTISGFLSVAATTGTFTNVGGTLSTVTQNSVTTMTGLTTIGTLVAGAVPASLVTAGTFGAGSYTFPGALALTGALSGVTTIAATGGITATSSSGVFLRLDETSANMDWRVESGVLGSWFAIRNLDRAVDDIRLNSGGGMFVNVAATFAGTLAVTGAATFSEKVFLGHATTTGMSAGEISLANAKYLRGLSAGFNYALIGISAAGKVDIDPAGVGIIMSGTLAVTGAVTTQARFISATSVGSTSFAATGGELFANSSYGGGVSGYGTIADVTLFSRAGNPALEVTANTVNLIARGTLAVTEACDFQSTIKAASLPTSAGAAGTLWVDTAGGFNIVKRV